jgi:hypothetical protein
MFSCFKFFNKCRMSTRDPRRLNKTVQTDDNDDFQVDGIITTEGFKHNLDYLTKPRPDRVTFWLPWPRHPRTQSQGSAKEPTRPQRPVNDPAQPNGGVVLPIKRNDIQIQGCRGPRTSKYQINFREHVKLSVYGSGNVQAKCIRRPLPPPIMGDFKRNPCHFCITESVEFSSVIGNRKLHQFVILKLESNYV